MAKNIETGNNLFPSRGRMATRLAAAVAGAGLLAACTSPNNNRSTPAPGPSTSNPDAVHSTVLSEAQSTKLSTSAQAVLTRAILLYKSALECSPRVATVCKDSAYHLGHPNEFRLLNTSAKAAAAVLTIESFTNPANGKGGFLTMFTQTEVSDPKDIYRYSLTLNSPLIQPGAALTTVTANKVAESAPLDLVNVGTPDSNLNFGLLHPGQITVNNEMDNSPKSAYPSAVSAVTGFSSELLQFAT